jgi:hypothetical protein
MAWPHFVNTLPTGRKTQEGAIMKIKTFTVATFVFVSLPLAAYAQGTLRGAEEGAAAGHRAAGPVGAVVGGTIGAAAGTVGGILGVEDRPRFREYVVREHQPSFTYGGAVRIGTVLPERGITLYAVPREYHARPGYRYAILNDRPVIVDLRTRRVVEIIE